MKKIGIHGTWISVVILIGLVGSMEVGRITYLSGMAWGLIVSAAAFIFSALAAK